MTKRFFFAVVVVGLVLGGIYMTQNRGPKNEMSTFRLGLITWVGYGPFWLAQEKDFFAEEGVAVELTTIDDTAQRKVALVQGSVDGLADTVDLLVLARSQNVPSVAVMEIDVSDGADGVVASQDIQTVKDLRGKRIAVQKNFVSEAFLNYVLQQNGLSPQDVETIDMEAGAAGAAFVAESVDVAVTFQPWLSKAKERKDGHVLMSTKDTPGVVVDILTVHESYLTEKRDAVQKVLRAWFKALAYLEQYPDEANTVMAKYYNMTPSEFAAVVADGVIWPTYEENKTYFGADGKGRVYEVAQTFIDVFQKTGQIAETPNMESAIDSSVLLDLYEGK